MQRLWHSTLIAATLAAAPLAHAQSNEELLQELRALKERVTQLEEALKAREEKEAAEAKAAAAKPPAPPPPPPGMTPQQVQDLNRVNVKTEMIEDALESFKGLRITGQLDPTYLYNHAQRRGGFQFLGPMRDDGYHYDSSYFGMAVIDLQKELENGIRVHLALAPNRGAGSAIDSGRSIVHEASVMIPLGDSQTRLLAGQIPNWSGYEAVLPNQNRLITHNLLFDFTQPRALVGAGAEWVAGQWVVKGLIANIDEGFRAGGQKTPVLAYRADWAKGEYRGYGFAGVHGKAPNRVNGGTGGGPDATLNLFEVDGYYNGSGWTAQGQLAFGSQSGAAITPDATTGALRDSRWWGVSGLFAYRLMPRLEAIVRADYLNNSGNGGGLYGSGADARDGIGPEMIGRGADGRLLFRNPDLGASRYALALGLNYVFNANVSFKAEYRLDHSTLPVFEIVNDGSFRRSNHLFGASMVLSF